MRDRPRSFRFVMCSPVLWLACACSCLNPAAAPAQTAPPASDAQALYRTIQSFELTGGTARVDNLTLKRDRAQMTFTGSFYFAAPANGRITGAVFIGEGTFRADVPPSRFEQDNLRRLLDAPTSSNRTSRRRSSASRTTRSTSSARGPRPGRRLPMPQARRRSSRSGCAGKPARASPARLAVSLLNDERPGVFVAEFDKGRRGRFTCLLDYQARIPVAYFRFNGGEKGADLHPQGGATISNDVWMAFYALDDYAKGTVSYSDAFNLVRCTALRSRRRPARREERVRRDRADGHDRARRPAARRAIRAQRVAPRTGDARLKRAPPRQVGPHRRRWRRSSSPGALGGRLHAAAAGAARGEGPACAVELRIEGDFMREIESTWGLYYPLSNECWYPRHGYLVRSTFDLTFHHDKNVKVAAVGTRVREERLTGSLVERVGHRLHARRAGRARELRGRTVRAPRRDERDGRHGRRCRSSSTRCRPPSQASRDPFVLAEMRNSINYFSALFGQYPFPGLPGDHPPVSASGRGCRRC